MNLIAEKGGLAQVENNNQNIFEEDYKEKLTDGIKENLILSIVSYLWNKSLESNSFTEQEGENFKKTFFKAWSSNVKTVTQNQLKEINEFLNDSNIDMLNIINGKKEVADIEDYQEILNKSMVEVEKIYWKICGK